jgi:hypothetical protein
MRDKSDVPMSAAVETARAANLSTDDDIVRLTAARKPSLEPPSYGM